MLQRDVILPSFGYVISDIYIVALANRGGCKIFAVVNVINTVIFNYDRFSINLVCLYCVVVFAVSDY